MPVPGQITGDARSTHERQNAKRDSLTGTSPAWRSNEASHHSSPARAATPDRAGAAMTFVHYLVMIVSPQRSALGQGKSRATELLPSHEHDGGGHVR